MHPYSKISKFQHWEKEISHKLFDNINWSLQKRINLNRKEKIISLGSCFAQHIAKILKKKKFNYYIAENDLKNKNCYSARYGNIYTVKQAYELLYRSFNNKNKPLKNDFWKVKNFLVDPFRPREFSTGFRTYDEILNARKKHYKAVRKAFSEASVIIFTLGLTETWIENSSNYSLPLAPGLYGGIYNKKNYTFLNLSYLENVLYFEKFYKLIKLLNKKFKIILTVSPVPLAATYEKQNVIISSTYSKSNLRTLAEEMMKKYENVYYFPSYEIITSHANKSKFFEKNLRNINSFGVNTVMRIFFDSYLISKKIKIDKKTTTTANCDEDIINEMVKKLPKL
jgi:hypothetical protein